MDLKELLGDAYKEGMTAEEIATALAAVDFPKPDPVPADNADIERMKAAVSKANSEAADYKKQLKARMTEDEQKEAERAAKEAERDALLESLQKDKTVSETTAQLLGLGYEAGLANETAKAMAEGDTTKVFANQKKHLEAVEKKLRSDILKDTPKPETGKGSESTTKEQFESMGYTARVKFFEENPELYNEYTGGNE